MAEQPLVRQGFHIVEASHTRYKPSGRVISPTQRPLTDNKQHSREREIHAPAGFGPVTPGNGRPQSHAIHHVATEVSVMLLPMCYYCKVSSLRFCLFPKYPLYCPLLLLFISCALYVIDLLLIDSGHYQSRTELTWITPRNIITFVTNFDFEQWRFSNINLFLSCNHLTLQCCREGWFWVRGLK